MGYMQQMQVPPPGMYATPPPGLPHSMDVPPPHIVQPIPEVVPAEVAAEPEKRADGGPLPEDLQEALDIIFPNANPHPESAPRQSHDNNVMYGSVYNMLGCVGYAPDYMDQPPPEITQQEPEIETAPGPDDLRMLGIDEGDTIL